MTVCSGEAAVLSTSTDDTAVAKCQSGRRDEPLSARCLIVEIRCCSSGDAWLKIICAADEISFEQMDVPCPCRCLADVVWASHMSVRFIE